MSQMPIAVLVSGSGSNLQVLIDAMKARKLPISIQCVISNRADSQALERAQKAGIPCAQISHKQFERREDFDAALLARVRESGAHLVVLAGFMRILTHVFVTPLSGRLINLHPSLLPKYPGLNPHEQALKAGETTHGATVHFVNEELDAGPIIIQGQVDITHEHDAQVVRRRVQEEAEYKIVPLSVKWYAEERLALSGDKVLLDGSVLPPQGYQYNGETL